VQRQIITTADGSKTIFIPEWNEHYHSSHGALQEAQHVFIRNGLNAATADYITILEMGFGTGLNALLTFFASEKRNQYVHYIAIEAFPPSPEEIAAMDYASFATDPETEAVYDSMHSTPWEQSFALSEHFVLEKQQCILENAQVQQGTVDLIYFDAFGPRVQPELWTLEIFQRLFAWLAPGGIFVTYCAKGQVKRDLKAAGFLVESLPGPPGKREMTRAFKPE
jgi:tRNA U34 5-methylaminomethyl-2-thiouridine-forming methyltransferase MnmC